MLDKVYKLQETSVDTKNYTLSAKINKIITSLSFRNFKNIFFLSLSEVICSELKLVLSDQIWDHYILLIFIFSLDKSFITLWVCKGLSLG